MFIDSIYGEFLNVWLISVFCRGDTRGAFRLGRRFNNEVITFSMPSNTDVCDIGTFTIWCELARSHFTRLVFPRTLFVSLY